MPESMVDQPDFARAECPSYLIRLNLNCRDRKKEGYIGVDAFDGFKPDIVADMNSYPWKWVEDNSVFQIQCEDYVQRVFDLQRFMEECYRILVPAGTINIIAPYYTCVLASEDFNNVRLISENTWYYFSKEWLSKYRSEYVEKVKCNFENIRTVHFYNPDWEARAEQAREWARVHYWNTIKQIEVTLRAIK